MELIQLKCFVALAETLNFKKAAERTYISQSSMSRYISSLESDLQVKLFERGKNFSASKLTPAGKAFLPKAKDLLTNATAARDAMVRFQPDPQENLRPMEIGIDTRLIHGIIPNCVYDFSKFTGVQIASKPIFFDQITRMLRDGEIDFALVTHVEDKYLNKFYYQVITQMPLVLCAHEDMIKRYGTSDPCEILKHEKVATLPEDMKINSHIMSILNKMEIQPDFKFCDSQPQMIFTIATNEAVAILPDESFSANPAIKRLPIPLEYGSIYIYALSQVETERTSLLIDYLKEHLNEGKPEAV